MVVYVREIPCENLGKDCPVRGSGQPRDDQDDETEDERSTSELLEDQWQNDFIDADFVLAPQHIAAFHNFRNDPFDDSNWLALEPIIRRLEKEKFRVDVSHDDQGVMHVRITRGEERRKYCTGSQSEAKVGTSTASGRSDVGLKKDLVWRLGRRLKRWYMVGGVSARRWREQLRDNY